MVLSAKSVLCALECVVVLTVGCGASPQQAASPAASGAQGCPSPPCTGVADSDGDGVPDTLDKCPTLKEDGKGAAPHDGCPDGFCGAPPCNMES
jgi:hypothetical protein